MKIIIHENNYYENNYLFRIIIIYELLLFMKGSRIIYESLKISCYEVGATDFQNLRTKLSR